MESLHRWDLSPSEARSIQERLRRRVLETPLDWARLHRVAGCDVAVAGQDLIAAVVVLDAKTLAPLETVDARAKARFPYVPGFLSFREIPVLAKAFEKLTTRPDVLLCDGQGSAHPRRFGIACHLGLLLELPSIGVAKSRLIGQAKEPASTRGSSTRIIDQGEVVGRLLRTRDRVKPVYVSIGHRITLDDAVRVVLKAGAGYRLPEPTRLADRHVGALARRETGSSVG